MRQQRGCRVPAGGACGPYLAAIGDVRLRVVPAFHRVAPAITGDSRVSGFGGRARG
jgi:hypothetical protein